MDFSLAFVQLDDNTIRVDAAVSCGHSFEGIALIHNAFSVDPQTGKRCSTLQLPKPLGFGAVLQIVQQWEQKAQQGKSKSD